MTTRMYVINEWLLEDLDNANGPGRRKQSLEFLQRLVKRCDRIAVLTPSPWSRKAYALMKHSDRDQATRVVSLYLRLKVLLNQDKCVLVHRRELGHAPQDVTSLTPLEDIYLVDLYFAASADSLVTTDTKLHANLGSTSKVTVLLRDDFIQEYLLD